MSPTKPIVTIPDDEVIEARSQAEGECSLPWTATSIRYQRDADRFLLQMLSGITLRIPRILVHEFDGISTNMLANVSIGLGGDTVQLKECDLDIALPGLLRGLFGLNSGQRNGGRARSAAKAIAAQRNGALGGRPRKESGQVVPDGRLSGTR